MHRVSSDIAMASGETPKLRCVIELHDSLSNNHLEVNQRLVPLETDLSIPLGYFLDNPHLNTDKIATLGLRRPEEAKGFEGIYMLEPFDPEKIPVLMVHGLASSPTTWMEMFNDLRALPELRNRFQFWFYLYPTGQPFWISAAKLRADLEELQHTFDPQRQNPAFCNMVLVGHSMGGLVSRMQVVESGREFWRIISDKQFEDLKTDADTREKLRSILFFQPNPSIQRVVTIGTPHRGSHFANDATRYLGRKLIDLPKRMVQASQRLLWDNPDFFKNTHLLTTTTSIDSLAPDSPVLPVLNHAQQAEWVHLHNIVGVIAKRGFLGRISETGDGIVDFDSAHWEDAESELTVEADHVNVQRHPRSVLEVRRILLEHLKQIDEQIRGRDSEPVDGQPDPQSEQPGVERADGPLAPQASAPSFMPTGPLRGVEPGIDASIFAFSFGD
jgi:pimeloyl-ACP methyl ester carboxylesterase